MYTKQPEVIDVLWQEYKDIVSLNKLYKLALELEPSETKERLLIKILSLVPQATASDTQLMIVELEFLREQNSSLKKELKSITKENDEFDKKVILEVSFELQKAYNRLPWINKWLLNVC